MEVYTLDSLLRRQAVFDRFESLIWTERFDQMGDFELKIRSTNETRSLLTKGTKLAMNESFRGMTVETTEDAVDNDGVQILTVKGRSFEAIFEDRVARPSTANLTTTPTWDLTGAPAALVRQIVHDICVTGVISPYDKIPFIVEGVLLPASNIPEPVDPITLNLDPQSVYAAITDICNTWSLGFRLLRNYDTSQLYFDVYAGSDRTTGQSVLSPVVFAPNLDNLQNTTELNTIQGAKNVALVISPVGYLEVVAEGVDPESDGFDRHVMVVKADDITAETTDPTAAMTQRGKEELAKNRAFQAFDGEINQNSQYKYQRDYYLGDLVEVRNTDGMTNDMRVTEQIFVSDKDGERSYPTLALNTFINTGSWLSWESNKHWIDYDADTTTTWATLP